MNNSLPKMETVVKHFSELSTDELYDIYRARAVVFVVGQRCCYQDVDDADRVAYHVFMRDADGLQAYLRVLPPGTAFPEASIGRVLSLKRRQGLATQLVRVGIEVARSKFHADTLTIEAQTYVRSLYDKLGFRQVSDEFLDVGIPHIKMQFDIPEDE